MKRDMDLIRKILLAIEMNQTGFAPDVSRLVGYSKEQIGYHSYLLYDAKLIVAVDQTTQGSLSPQADPRYLTWAGHEFIDNAKNEEVWGQAKQVISKLGDVSFVVWTSVIAEIVNDKIQPYLHQPN